MTLRLTSRIVLFFALLATVLLATVGVLSYRSGSESLKQAAVSEVVAKAIEKEAALDAWFEERLADLRQIADQGDLVGAMEELMAAAPGSDEERSARELILGEIKPHLNSAGSGMLELFVIEPEGGKVVVSTTPAEEGKSKIGHPYFDHGRNDLYLQAPYLSEDLKVPAMTAAMPLRAADGRVVAVLAGQLDIAALSTIVLRRTGLRQSEDAFLTNAGRFPITQPRFLSEPVVLRRQFDTEAARRVAGRLSGVVLAADYRGVPTIAVYRWNAKHQLGLIVKIDQAEALAPAHEFGRSVLWISALALLAAAGLAALLARTITRPLRDLKVGIRHFAEGNFVVPLPETSGDEVGLLAREFNAMAARVVERTAELSAANELLAAENTERRRVEVALKESAAKLEGVFRTAPIGIGLVANRTLLEMNDGLCRAFGYSNEELLGKNSRFLYPTAEEYEAAGRRFRDENGAGTLSMETRFLCKDGRIIDAAVSWAAVVPGNPAAGLVLTIMDITERKRAEEELRAAHAQLAHLFEHSPVITYGHRIEGETIIPGAASGNFTRLLGFTNEEAMSMEWWLGHLHPDDRERALASIPETISQGTSRTEYRVRHQDGHYLWMEDSRRLVRDASGQPAEIIGAWTDITERREAEEALRESKRFIENVTNNTPDFVYVFDLETSSNVYVNRRVEDSLGYSHAQILELGDRFLPTITHPEDLPRLAQHLAHFSDVPDNRTYEIEYRTKDAHGDWRWFLERDNVFKRRPNGAAWQIAGTAQDITERKKADAALGESEARFRSIIESAQDGFVSIDGSGKIVNWNRRAEAIFGWSRTEAIGRPLHETIIPERLRAAHLQGIRHLQATSEGPVLNRTIEIPALRRSGEEFPVEMTVWPIETNSGTIFNAFLRDITERKAADAALRENEERMRLLVSASNVGLWDWNLGTNEVFFSAEWKRQLGYTDAELPSRYEEWEGRLHPEDREPTLAAVKDFIAGRRENFDVEFRLRHKDESWRWIFSSASLTRDATGQPVRVMGCHIDITERKQAEVALEQAHKELVNLSRQAGMSEIATSVLHNVGNVLNSVNVSADLLADHVRKTPVADLSRVVALLREHDTNLGAFFSEDPRGAKVPEFLGKLAAHFSRVQETQLKEVLSLQKNVEHIKEIVAMQQSYARISGVTERLHVTDLVEDALRMNLGAFQRHDVQVVREFAPGLPAVITEKHKLLQILINLLSNAKYACDGAAGGDKRVTVRAAQADGRIRVEVIDTGVGIAPEHRGRIFNLGFTTKKDGHGFGLHSAANAAREMGGSLTVHSDGPGRGATFTLELPCPAVEVAHA